MQHFHAIVYLDSPVIEIIDKKEGNSTTTAMENGNRAINHISAEVIIRQIICW